MPPSTLVHPPVRVYTSAGVDAQRAYRRPTSRTLLDVEKPGGVFRFTPLGFPMRPHALIMRPHPALVLYLEQNVASEINYALELVAYRTRLTPFAAEALSILDRDEKPR